ncbi:MAG: hypothetical protein HQM06_00980 [Magnetococcales bacterium]|nr:hypothetical protein [Magnetococcales bacterium]
MTPPHGIQREIGNVRILIVLLLALLVLLGALYGVRLLWRAWHPDNQEVLDGQGTEKKILSRNEQLLGWIILALTLLLFIVMISERMELDGSTPADWTAPPPVQSHRKAP